ncbi:hypothetical protein JCM10207_003466 [Rhodosporidiobolus poonsookiae]
MNPYESYYDPSHPSSRLPDPALGLHSPPSTPGPAGAGEAAWDAAGLGGALGEAQGGWRGTQRQWGAATGLAATAHAQAYPNQQLQPSGGLDPLAAAAQAIAARPNWIDPLLLPSRSPSLPASQAALRDPTPSADALLAVKEEKVAGPSSRWTAAEEQYLLIAVGRHGKRWVQVQADLVKRGYAKRSVTQLQRHHRVLVQRQEVQADADAAGLSLPSPSTWTGEEDGALLSLSDALGGHLTAAGTARKTIDWDAAMPYFPGRVKDDLRKRLETLKRKAKKDDEARRKKAEEEKATRDALAAFQAKQDTQAAHIASAAKNAAALLAFGQPAAPPRPAVIPQPPTFPPAPSSCVASSSALLTGLGITLPASRATAVPRPLASSSQAPAPPAISHSPAPSFSAAAPDPAARTGLKIVLPPSRGTAAPRPPASSRSTRPPLHFLDPSKAQAQAPWARAPAAAPASRQPPTHAQVVHPLPAKVTSAPFFPSPSPAPALSSSSFSASAARAAAPDPAPKPKKKDESPARYEPYWPPKEVRVRLRRIREKLAFSEGEWAEL